MKHLGGAKIKHYKTLISKAKLERDQLSQEYRSLQSKMDRANNLLKRYKSELADISSSSSTLIVSEHAMLRYLERVYKLSLTNIETEIATPILYNKVQEYGNGTYHCENGFSAKVVDGVIVTILDSHKKQTIKKKKKSISADQRGDKPLRCEIAQYYEGVNDA